MPHAVTITFADGERRRVARNDHPVRPMPLIPFQTGTVIDYLDSPSCFGLYFSIHSSRLFSAPSAALALPTDEPSDHEHGPHESDDHAYADEQIGENDSGATLDAHRPSVGRMGSPVHPLRCFHMGAVRTGYGSCASPPVWLHRTLPAQPSP
jgi:hypothetical protein